MKYTTTKILTGLSIASVLLLSQSATAATTQQCQQFKKQMVKSNYAKKQYHQHCKAKKSRMALPRLTLKRAKTKQQLEKERLERERKLKHARAKAAKAKMATGKKGLSKGIRKTSKGSIFKSAPRSRFYVGANFGLSTLKPKASGVGVSVTDTADKAFKGELGFQFKPRFAVEGFYADLGEATIKTQNVTNGKVGYKMMGVNVVYSQPFGSRVKGLVKTGYAKVDNSFSKGFSNKQVKDGSIFGSLGLEAVIIPRLSILGEYSYYAKDIQLLSGGLKFKF